MHFSMVHNYSVPIRNYKWLDTRATYYYSKFSCSKLFAGDVNLNFGTHVSRGAKGTRVTRGVKGTCGSRGLREIIDGGMSIIDGVQEGSRQVSGRLANKNLGKPANSCKDAQTCRIRSKI